jgi:hypothetical protein
LSGPASRPDRAATSANAAAGEGGRCPGQRLRREPDGSHERKLADGVAGSWSPDARKIVCSPGFAAPLNLINPGGSHMRTIASSPAFDPDWR